MKNLKINLEPRITLPKDEDGDTYIGVYIDDELVSKITVGEGSASSVTNNGNSIQSTVQDTDKKTSIDINNGAISVDTDVKTWFDVAKIRQKREG